jgi:MFS family permease
MAAASIPLQPAQAQPGHPLRIPYFRNLWLGSTVSVFGDQFYLVALPWLVLQLTGSSLALGTILMLAAVPRAVLMLMGGVVSDRVSPRRILMTTASVRTVLVAAIAALAWLQIIHLWHIYVLAFAFGLADAFAFPAGQALMPSLVSTEQLPAANSAIQSSYQLCTIAGPAPAGLIVKRWGMPIAFFLDAISFLFVIAALARLPETWQLRPHAARTGVWHSIMEGLRYVLHDPALRSLMLLTASLNFCFAGPIAVGLATMAKFRFGSSAAFGTMLSCFGGGALAGMVLAGVWKKRHRRGLLLIGLAFCLGLGLTALAVVRPLWAVGTVLGLMGVGSGFVNIQIVSWMQAKVDRQLLGRVMSVLMFAAVGLAPVSLGFAGAVAQLHLDLMFAVAGGLVLLSAAVAGSNRATREID